MGKANKYSADLLRRKAETIIERKEVNLSNQLSEVEILRLIHELEVHQIELQLINDELNTAKENEELLAERFAELFDFAPSGYFILSRSGEIIELNRSGAEILGEKRLFLLGKHLSQFISHESGSAFVEFLDAVFQNAKNQKCKITLSGADKIPCYIQFIGSAFLETGQCLLNAIDITELVLAEEALALSREQLIFLVQEMQVGVLLQGPNAEILMSNNKALELLGLSEDQLLGLSSFSPEWNVIHDDGSPFPGETHPVPRSIATRLPVTDVVMGVYRPVTGDRVWLLVSATPQLTRDGSIKQVVCTFIDITLRRMAELKLIQARKNADESEFFLKQSQSAGNIGSYKTDFISGYWRSSETLDMIFGIGPDYDRSVASWLNLVHPDERDSMNDYLISEVIAKKIPFEREYRIARINDGQTRWVQGFGATSFDNSGNITEMIGTIQDITERKLNDFELKKAKEKAEEDALQQLALIDNAIFPVNIISLDGKFIYCNSASCKLFGMKIEQIENYNPSHFWLNKKQRMMFTEEIRSKGNIANAEADFCTAANEFKTLLVSSRIISYNKQQVIFSIYNDITERKLLERSLLLAKEKAEEGDKLKSAFLANMSHEIRTPMNGILGFADLLKEPKLSDNEKLEYIGIIEKSGARMLNIINDIIDISKIESGLMNLNISESNINEQIEYIYTFFKPEVEKKGMQLLFRNGLTSFESVIMTDREKVFAILTNLVKNAIKFSDAGTIEFGYKLISIEDKASLVSTTHMELQFFVKDHGIGIPEERQDAVFERFVQADIEDKRAFQGAGLGLAITKKYVEMLGGKIWVESKAGKGSVFCFTIPYETPVKNNPDTEFVPDETLNMDKKLKVLIVEDDYASARLLLIRVKSFVREVLNARTGGEAIQLCHEHPDIDLILMDIHMPELNGYDAVRQIRQFNENVVIIAQTAYGLLGDKEKAKAAGCDDYVSKPIDMKALKRLIDKYLNEKTSLG